MKQESPRNVAFPLVFRSTGEERPMSPVPIALGLTLCEKVIVEERTRNLTFVSTFTKLLADEFPSPPERFAFAAVLTGGQGEGTVDLVITHLETDEETYSLQRQLHFPSRLAEVRVVFHIRDCSFPAPGQDDATLFVDGDPVARRKFSIEAREEGP
jgi:hypothetical protein